MKPIGVIIARFQTPFLHEGHRTLISEVIGLHSRVLIVLGVSPVLGSRRNPLDFHSREVMIKKEFPEVVVLPLPDHPLDAQWSRNLDLLLLESFPGHRFLLYGSRDSFIPSYSGRFETHELPEAAADSATLIREKTSGQVGASIEFRSGVIYAYANTYPKVYPTVDIAVFRASRQELLLGKKDIDRLWRLPGGFADPTDESFEAAARRELREECGDILTGPMHYEYSTRVSDWRYRSEVDKIVTCLFTADYVAGTPVASDDLAELDWFALDKLPELIAKGQVAPEHIAQMLHLLKITEK